MSNKIRVIVKPGKINAEDEEAINQAVTNALIVQKGFFPSQESDVTKTVQVVVVIETEDVNVSKAQYQFLKNLHQEGVVEEVNIYSGSENLLLSVNL